VLPVKILYVCAPIIVNLHYPKLITNLPSRGEDFVIVYIIILINSDKAVTPSQSDTNTSTTLHYTKAYNNKLQTNIQLMIHKYTATFIANEPAIVESLSMDTPEWWTTWKLV